MKIRILCLFCFLTCNSPAAFSQATTFVYTGAVQTYTVPACVNSITVDARGGEGATITASLGGKGGKVQATIATTPGEVLNIYVGGAATGVTAGFNGGGLAGTGGAAGAGASDIRQGGTALSNRVIVAAGGAGVGTPAGCPTNSGGGDGGGLSGADGWWCGSQTSSLRGQGGTQTTGGAGGNGGLPGALGVGGTGGSQGGGGGGGLYGGGGGGVAGGGGGSSYAIGTATGVTHTPGIQVGNGQITLTPIVTTGPATPGPITGSILLCSGTTGTYTIPSVPGATSYTWTFPPGSVINSGQGTTSASVTFGSSSGTISVTATNSCGTSAAATMAVTVNPTPATPVAAVSGPTCIGGMLNLTANTVSGATYSWTGPNGFSSTMQNPSVPGITMAQSGTYSLVVTQNGCPSAPGIVTVTVYPLPVLGPDTIICISASLVLNPGNFSNYTWHDNSTLPTFTVDGTTLGPGTYTFYVDVIDASGCVGTDSVNVVVSACVGDNENSIEAVELFPNPTDGLLNIHVNNVLNDHLTFTIRNITGQVVFEKQVETSAFSFTGQLDISPLAKGIYYLEVNSGETFSVKKVVLN